MKAALFLLSTLISFSASAQVRTWVSTGGSDTNPCSRNLPCRNFAAAIGVVSDGGEVVVLDSGGYGAVTVDKSVSLISPPGIHAAIAPTDGTALTIEASDGRVTVKNLFLNGQGALLGVEVLDAASIVIEGSTVSNFAVRGIYASPSDTFFFTLKDSMLLNNGQDGMRMEAMAGTSNFALVESTLIQNHTSQGLEAISQGGLVRVTARNVHSVRNGIQFYANAELNGTTRLYLEASSAIGDLSLDHGIRAFAGGGESVSTVLVSESLITGNANGITTSGASASVLSRGNNTLDGNLADEIFSGPYPAK